MRGLMASMFAASLVLVSSVRAETPEKMIAAAKALDLAFVKAFNAGDSAKLAATYWHSPEVVSFPPDMMEARGWDAIKTGLADMKKSMPGAKLEMTETQYTVAGEYVLTWGKWRMTMPGPDGKPVAMEGRYTDVKAKRDGKWVFIHDHASVPMPPPPEK